MDNLHSIDLQLLDKYVADNLIAKQKHPDYDLWIYNYTSECVFSKKWNEITMMCRGLVLDLAGRVIAKPFPKFFNYEELTISLPSGIPQITKKLDGSLIIAFAYNDKVIVCTRGSFVSEQSIDAGNLLCNIPNGVLTILNNKNKTFLFEYTSPTNRIVIAYSQPKITLLTVVDNINFSESLDEWGNVFDIVEKKNIEWNADTITELKNLNTQGEEGFVLKWSNGFRVKIKFEDYFRLHKLITGLNEKTIWEHLRDGKQIDDLVKQVPEEFEEWVRGVSNDLLDKFMSISMYCDSFLQVENLYSLPRKDSALIIMSKAKEYSSVLFNLLDNRNEKVRECIYKMIKPKTNNYFKEIIKEEL